MKELVVISGKGGTGKTSLLASFAALAGESVIVDCDVDAPDLHLVLAPAVDRDEPFVGGKLARVEADKCAACGKCQALCRFDAVRVERPADGAGPLSYRIDPVACEGCGVCAWFCPEKAIAFQPVVRGSWFRSGTRLGPMLHARLDAAGENSGKLVSTLREEARSTAASTGKELILVDGSPGIGCPVIASLTGASLALVVTEPTLSGKHDMERVLGLARELKVRAAVCVNRADLDPELADELERSASAAGATILPRVPFDRAVGEAQMQGRPVVEMGSSPAGRQIEKGWRELCRLL